LDVCGNTNTPTKGKKLAHKIIGLDLGGNSINVTAYDGTGFLIQDMCELPSLATQGPSTCVSQLVQGFLKGLHLTGWTADEVDAVGLDTPGPVSGTGVLCATGATNFGHAEYANFDIRGALEKEIAKPVYFLNDGNAAGLYAHWRSFGDDHSKTSMSLIVGTGLGGGIVVGGHVVIGRVGFGAELGHVSLPVDWNPNERFDAKCNCGRTSDLESIASLTGIELNLLPHYLPRYPGHPLAELTPKDAAKKVRGLAEKGDPLAREIFQAQCWALAAHIDQMINVLDMDAVFIGGGVIEASDEMRNWYLKSIHAAIPFRHEQRDLPLEIVPDGDRAGARGVAVYASQQVREGR
jgi:predicted NBD/HSP70 family sugar kinase